MNSSRVIALLCALSISVLEINAQCCAAGSPDSDVGVGDGGGKNKLLITTGYQRSFSDTYFEGTEKSDFKYMANSYFDFNSLRLTYGVTNKLRLSLNMGYFMSKSQNFESGYFRKAVGRADASISANYLVWKSEKFKLFPMATLTIPTGVFDQKYGPVILPIDLQPSAGSYRYSAGLLAVDKINNKLTLTALGSYEISQRIQTKNTSYKYGGLTNFRMTGTYRISKHWSTQLQAWYQYRERAVDQNMLTINATGGHLIFICPEVSYSFSKNWKVKTNYERPVYKNMNGLQLTNKHRYSIQISKMLDLNKKKESYDLEALLKLDSSEYGVAGICGMCKTRIEQTAMGVHGIAYAKWDVDSKVLHVKRLDNFSEDKLVNALLKAGHDTEMKKASSKAYGHLHECCKYRSGEI